MKIVNFLKILTFVMSFRANAFFFIANDRIFGTISAILIAFKIIWVEYITFVENIFG